MSCFLKFQSVVYIENVSYQQLKASHVIENKQTNKQNNKQRDN